MSEEVPGLTVLPPNRSLLEAGLDLAFAKFLERIAPPFPELMDAQATPAEFLPYLAADRGVSEWRTEAPEAEKRLTVASAWAVKRLAGTRRALDLAVESLGLDPEVTAWHQDVPPGSPYWLRVVARATGELDDSTYQRLLARLGEAKAERDMLALDIVSEVRGALYYGAAVCTGSSTTVFPYSAPDSEVQGLLYFGGFVRAITTTTVYP